MYEELKKLADLRIDILNTIFNIPAETTVGKDFVRRTDQTIAGKWYRFKQWVKRNYPGIAGSIFGLGSLIISVWQTIVSTLNSTAYHGYRATAYVGRKVVSAGTATTAAVGYVLNRAYSLIPSGRTISETTNTLSNIANTAGNIVSSGVDIASGVIKTGADVAKFLADNTIALFVAIITVIGLIYSTATSRKK